MATIEDVSETPPDGPILAVSVGDLHEKEAILAARLACAPRDIAEQYAQR